MLDSDSILADNDKLSLIATSIGRCVGSQESFKSFQFAAIANDDERLGITGLTSQSFYFFHDIHPFQYPAENHMLAVKVRGWNGGDEEL